MNDAAPFHRTSSDDTDWQALAQHIKTWAGELGFADCRIADLAVDEAAARLRDWLARGWHGDMAYLERHVQWRAAPQRWVPGVLRAICVTLPYLPYDDESWQQREWQGIGQPARAQISLYARGRDYHKVVRQRLQQLASVIAEHVPHEYRVCSDSAPVMEVELAQQAGLGWRGKHTLLLNRSGGSMFFLGEILTTLPLPIDPPGTEHCGTCQACIDICPTGAIVAPYQLDARRCISYLTIEHAGSIPVPWRSAIGNRIYGCDDCQLICPWNKFAQVSQLPDFAPRHRLDASDLLELWAWDEAVFLQRTEGSAIRRIGYERWRRNLAVGLGNALRVTTLDKALAQHMRQALHDALPTASALVREHISWALQATPLDAAD